MAYRYTNTEKWADAWFSNLKPYEKLLFGYLCDNCDIAGFIEIRINNWAVDIGFSKEDCEGALKGLQRGLIYSQSDGCIYIRTFLKHQKNLPLDPQKNPAHRGIIRCFDTYLYKFGFTNLNEFLKGALKGLGSPYGNGIGNGNGIKEEKKFEKEEFISHAQLIKRFNNGENDIWQEFEFVKQDINGKALYKRKKIQ